MKNKNKIKVMNMRQELTDEEIERFKNFDVLMNRYQQTIATKRINWLKWVVPSVVLISSILYFIVKEETSKTTFKQPIFEPVTPLPADSFTETQKEIKNSTGESLVGSANEKTIEAKEIKEAPTPTPIEGNQANEQLYIQAEPIDGYAALYEYFSKELIYPTATLPDSVQGVLTVTFIMNRNGKAENIQFSGSLGKPFEEEANRLIENMPPWKAATLNGRPVPSKMSLPLTFQIQQLKQKD